MDTPPPPEDAAGADGRPEAESAALPPAGQPVSSVPSGARYRRLRRRLLRELAFVLVLGAPLVLLVLIFAPRNDAGRLLRSLSPVRVAQTPFDRIERLATQFGASGACVGDECLFQFQNTWLYRLHLAPVTQFSVLLRRHGSPGDPGGGTVGSLDFSMLVVRSPGVGDAIASALVFERAGPQPGGPFQVSVLINHRGVPGRTIVRLASGATALQRRAARAFNLRCLTRLGGCTSSRQLLPEVWRGARRIQSVRGPAPASSALAAALTFGPVH